MGKTTTVPGVLPNGGGFTADGTVVTALQVLTGKQAVLSPKSTYADQTAFFSCISKANTTPMVIHTEKQTATCTPELLGDHLYTVLSTSTPNGQDMVTLRDPSGEVCTYALGDVWASLCDVQHLTNFDGL